MNPGNAGSLSLDHLSKRFADHLAVADVTLDVAPGEMIVLLGPSGCGKTTTLRMIAGFVQASGGDIRVDGASILALPPHRREMGIVFQSYALFPHLDVTRNIGFGLEMRGWRRARIAERVTEMLALVKLERFADRRPGQLSGGQQQRVALARALAVRPRLLLLDEPLSNLDAALRLEVGREIRILQRAGGITTIMVTHDQDEAMAMADRLVVMRDGRVQQIGRQADLYERPANPFVARFIGQCNILAGQLIGGRLQADTATVKLRRHYAATATTVQLAVRPERVVLLAPDDPDACVSGEIALSTYLGAVVEHVVRLGPELTIVVRGASAGPDAARLLDAGTRVGLGWDATAELLYGPDDEIIPAVTGTAERHQENRMTSHA